jgi:hypothetical protein
MSSRTRSPIRIVPADAPETSAAAEPLPLHAVSLFCDDVRAEATGKLMLIGCYPGNVINLHASQPIDRLAVVTKIIWARDIDPAGMRLRFDMPAQEPNFMPVQVNPAAADHEMEPTAVCVWHLRFMPLRPGDIVRVGLDYRGRLIHAGELRALAVAMATAATRH